jgi:hypothetical protein
MNTHLVIASSLEVSNSQKPSLIKAKAWHITNNEWAVSHRWLCTVVCAVPHGQTALGQEERVCEALQLGSVIRS